MKPLIIQIHKRLLKNKKTIAVAESCTGGLLSKLLTDQSGSSKYFLLGLVTYSNTAKTTILKVPPSLIVNNGAVSANVALAMAKQVRKIAKTDFGIGITGIAGPTGGTSSKPVGTVYACVCSKNRTLCKKFRSKGTRAMVRNAAAAKALTLLKRLL